MLTALAVKVLYREVDREQHSRLYGWAIWYLGRGFLRAPHRFQWQFEWKKEDAWIGAFWRSSACCPACHCTYLGSCASVRHGAGR